MKDAKGHGSDSRGAAHQAGVENALGNGSIQGKDGRAFDVTHGLGVNGEHHYHVMDAGQEVGEARLSHTGQYVVDLGVKPGYRSNGVASALYNHIENHIGRKLSPSPVYQTPAGQKFWASRRKP